MSLPARGAWIEILEVLEEVEGEADRRSPHGERGLKSLSRNPASSVAQSLPARGAWIEIG